jgi:hypothetical protein
VAAHPTDRHQVVNEYAFETAACQDCISGLLILFLISLSLFGGSICGVCLGIETMGRILMQKLA